MEVGERWRLKWKGDEERNGDEEVDGDGKGREGR